MPARFTFLVLVYLLSAIPWGLVLTTLYGGDADIRRTGSGNIGATNVARVYGWNMAGPVLALDVLKGLVPVLLAWATFGDGLLYLGLVAGTAFLGHCYPIYLEFRGGKGVATAAGGMLALSPWPTLAAFLAWGTLLSVSGRSSVASLGAAVTLLGVVWYWDPVVLPVAAFIGAGIAVTHVTNLRRLLRGQEKAIIRPVRFGRKAVEEPSGASVLEQGPAGGAAVALWKEADVDPLEESSPPADAEE